jgi:hypothetical protein
MPDFATIASQLLAFLSQIEGYANTGDMIRHAEAVAGARFCAELLTAMNAAQADPKNPDKLDVVRALLGTGAKFLP